MKFDRSSLTVSSVIALVIGLAVTVSGVHAHKGATGVVMERMMAMKSMGDAMKSLAAMVTGKAVFEADEVHKIGSRIKAHAADIPTMFPKGSIKGPSEATPAIWSDWESFKKHASELEKLATQLEGEAGSQKSVALGLFAKMGKTCSGCHEDFRQKKN